MMRKATEAVGKHGKANIGRYENCRCQRGSRAQTMIAPIACDDSKRINDMYDKIGICKSDISRKELTEEIIGIKEPMGVLHLSQS